MKTNIIIGVGVALIACGGGGYWYAQQQISKDAEREVRYFLSDNNLDDKVRYGNVSASLIGGSLTIENVELSDEISAPVTIDKLVVSNLNEDRGTIYSIQVDAKGIKFPLLENARMGSYPKAGMLGNVTGSMAKGANSFVTLGYTQLEGQSSVSYEYDPDVGSANISVSGDFDQAFSVELDVGMDDLRESLIEALIELPQRMQKKGNPLAMLSGLDSVFRDVTRVGLTNLRVSFSDHGVLERSKESALEDEFFKNGSTRVLTMSVDDHMEEGSRDWIKERRDKLIDLGVGRRSADDFSDAIGAFVLDGGTLVLDTEIDRPIRLAQKVSGMLPIAPAKDIASLDRFIRASRLTIAVE